MSFGPTLQLSWQPKQFRVSTEIACGNESLLVKRHTTEDTRAINPLSEHSLTGVTQWAGGKHNRKEASKHIEDSRFEHVFDT